MEFWSKRFVLPRQPIRWGMSMTYKVWQVCCSVCFLGWGWSPVYSKKQGTDGERRQSLWKSSKENP